MYDLKLIQRGGRRKLRKFNPAELKVIKPNRWLPAFQVCHDPERNPVTFPRKFVASLYHHRVSSLVTSFRQSGPHPPSTFPQHSARTVNGVETQPGEKNSFIGEACSPLRKNFTGMGNREWRSVRMNHDGGDRFVEIFLQKFLRVLDVLKFEKLNLSKMCT